MGIILESIFTAIGIIAVGIAILYEIWLFDDTNAKVTRILKILEEEESEDKE
jgi:hypothetical protein